MGEQELRAAAKCWDEVVAYVLDPGKLPPGAVIKITLDHHVILYVVELIDILNEQLSAMGEFP